MHTRDFSTAQCVVYALRPDKAKVPVDWNTLSSYLAGSEVTLTTYTHVLVCMLYPSANSLLVRTGYIHHLEKWYIYIYMYICMYIVCTHNVNFCTCRYMWSTDRL